MKVHSGKATLPLKKVDRKGFSHTRHKTHSPFFLLWEVATLTCVFLIGFSFLIVPLFHVSEEAHHSIELAVEAAEIILIAEVILLVLVARDKVKFVFKNWLTILAVVPFGGGFRIISAFKIGWHAFEKTKLGHFLHHPIRISRRWIHINLGLRV